MLFRIDNGIANASVQAMTDIYHEFQLRKGDRCVIREPRGGRDLERLAMFFSALPEERRNYLRYNVNDVEILRRRLEQLSGDDHWRLIAEVGGEIVGDATLDRDLFGWKRHVAQIRGVVSPDFDEANLGSVLYTELVQIGDVAGIEMLYAEVMPQQKEVIKILGEAGFERSAILPMFAKDLKGQLQDLHVYTNDLNLVWQRLAEHLEMMDIRMSD